MSEVLANREHGRRALQHASSSGLCFYGERLEDVWGFWVDYSQNNHSAAVQRERTSQGLCQLFIEQHRDRLPIVLGEEEVRFVVPNDAEPSGEGDRGLVLRIRV